MIAFWENKIRMPKEEPDEFLLKSEVERMLKDKGYLAKEQKWEDFVRQSK